MGCWEVLGLTSDADEATVRRAYAALLKLHRPDRDPAGFQRVRGAYEQALLLVRRRRAAAAVEEQPDDDDGASEEDDAAPAPGGSPGPPAASAPPAAEASAPAPASAATAPPATVPPPPEEVGAPAAAAAAAPVPAAVPAPAPPSPDPFAVALERLRLLAADHPPAAGPLVEALRELARARGPHEAPARWHAWRSATLVWARRAPAAVAAAVDDADLLRDLLLGHDALATAVLEHAFAQRDWDRLERFAAGLLEQVDDLSTRLGAQLPLWLAVRLAVVDYRLAQDLVERGSSQRHAARSAQPEVDRAMTVGREARTLPRASRIYLANLLLHGPQPRPGPQALRRSTGEALRANRGTYLGRLLQSRFPGHFRGDLVTGAVGVRITVLGVAVACAGCVAVVAAMVPLISVLALDPGPVIALLLVIIGAVIAACIVGYRRAVGPWEDRFKPWCARRAGPFDLGCLLVVVGVEAQVAALVTAVADDSFLGGLAMLLAGLAGALALARHGRRWLRHAATGWRRFLPPWPHDVAFDRARLGLPALALGAASGALIAAPLAVLFPGDLGPLWVSGVCLAGLLVYLWMVYLDAWRDWPRRQGWAAGARVLAACALAGGALAGPAAAVLLALRHRAAAHVPGGGATATAAVGLAPLAIALLCWGAARLLARGPAPVARARQAPVGLYVFDPPARRAGGLSLSWFRPRLQPLVGLLLALGILLAVVGCFRHGSPGAGAGLAVFLGRVVHGLWKREG